MQQLNLADIEPEICLKLNPKKCPVIRRSQFKIAVPVLPSRHKVQFIQVFFSICLPSSSLNFWFLALEKLMALR